MEIIIVMFIQAEGIVISSERHGKQDTQLTAFASLTCEVQELK